MLYLNLCLLKITRLLCTRQKPEFDIYSNTVTRGLTHLVISTMAVQTSLAIVLSGLMKCLSESWDVGTWIKLICGRGDRIVCDQSSMNVWSFLDNNSCMCCLCCTCFSVSSLFPSYGLFTSCIMKLMVCLPYI